MSVKFVASYSGGKDSILAVHRAIAQGFEPCALITTYNTDKNRSWFHGIPEPLLQEVSRSLNIPIWLIKTSGADYAKNFEQTLIKAREHGAEMCIFGDIDIQEHNDWCSERCANAGIKAFFPLWGEPRRKLVYEFIDAGFCANITVIDTKRMNAQYLGEQLSRPLVDKIADEGVDICGENGEYHTFVSAGPLFKLPLNFAFKEAIIDNQYAILPLAD